MGEQEGEEERAMVAIAILAKRRLRLNEMGRVRIRLSSHCFLTGLAPHRNSKINADERV